MRVERRERGQALIEAAVAIVAIVLLAAGILEFGRAFMIANMVTHAARDAARYAATLPKEPYREENGCFAVGANAGTLVSTYVENLIGTVMDQNGEGIEVQVGQCLAAETNAPLVRVQICGDIDAITGLVTAGQLPIDRVATYRDEGGTVGVDCGTCPEPCA